MQNLSLKCVVSHSAGQSSPLVSHFSYPWFISFPCLNIPNFDYFPQDAGAVLNFFSLRRDKLVYNFINKLEATQHLPPPTQSPWPRPPRGPPPRAQSEILRPPPPPRHFTIPSSPELHTALFLLYSHFSSSPWPIGMFIYFLSLLRLFFMLRPNSSPLLPIQTPKVQRLLFSSPSPFNSSVFSPSSHSSAEMVYSRGCSTNWSKSQRASFSPILFHASPTLHQSFLKGLGVLGSRTAGPPLRLGFILLLLLRWQLS